MNTLVIFATLIAAGGIGSGRLLPSIAAVLGLIGVLIGSLALARFRRLGDGRGGAIGATALGIVGLTIGGVHAANTAGGFGTGNGLAGAIAAIVLGLVGTGLGGLALARSRHI